MEWIVAPLSSSGVAGYETIFPVSIGTSGVKLEYRFKLETFSFPSVKSKVQLSKAMMRPRAPYHSLKQREGESSDTYNDLKRHLVLNVDAS